MSPLPVTLLLLLAASASANIYTIHEDEDDNEDVLTCARIFFHKDYNTFLWANVEDGENQMMVGGWNDRVSSIKVKQGCTFAVWWDTEQEGLHMDIKSNIANLHNFEGYDGEDWNDKISSLRCYC